MFCPCAEAKEDGCQGQQQNGKNTFTGKKQRQSGNADTDLTGSLRPAGSTDGAPGQPGPYSDILYSKQTENQGRRVRSSELFLSRLLLLTGAVHWYFLTDLPRLLVDSRSNQVDSRDEHHTLKAQTL